MGKSEILHEDVPDGDDMADAAEEDEEVEGGVHVAAAAAEAVEDGAGDVADAFGHDPVDGDEGGSVHQGLEGDEHGESHEAEAERLDIGVLLQAAERDDGAGQGAEPHEGEEPPAPEALGAEDGERDGRVGAGDVPVDGRVVPTAQPLLPRALCGQGMIDGRGDVAGEHAGQIEADAQRGPAVGGPGGHADEDRADDEGQHCAGGVRP